MMAMDNPYEFAQSAATNIFIVRNGERSIDDWRRSGIVAIGWSEALGLDKEPNWGRFKSIIREAYAPHWPTMNEQSLSLQASSAFQFIQSIRVNDLVLVPVPGAFLAAKVLSDSKYDPTAKQADSAWQHTVEWLTSQPIPRSHGGNALQRRLKVRQTCVNVNDLRKDVLEALVRKAPISFNEVVLAQASAPVANALLNSINDVQLEELVVLLAQAAGAKAERPPKNSRLPGDVDVVATYDLRIGTEESTVKVAYQVKQHEAVTGIFGVQQLVDRMGADPEIVRGYFVTTADELAPAAQTLADENDIVVIKKKGLVEWILMSGLGVLQ
jgi:predicted Mrr-cat superfamily restriction endonuclease